MNMMDEFMVKISQEVQEKQDEFIFRTLCDFAETNYQVKVDKYELIAAINLIRVKKEYGENISAEWLNTVRDKKIAMDAAYKLGYEKGVADEKERILAAIENNLLEGGEQ